MEESAKNTSDLLATVTTKLQASLENNLFLPFSDPDLAIWLSAAILIFGAIFTIWIIAGKWLPVRFQLLKLERAIRSTKDYLDFVEGFPKIDEAMLAVRMVRHGWKELNETLVFPQPDSNKPIQNTSRPSSYINMGEAETSGLNLKFFQAVPNYFVGVGLLFTFLGLVAALYFASQGIKGQDIAATQTSLQNLLHAATFKFLTSVAGITSSLVVGITYRLVTGNLQKHFDNLCEALEQRLLFATAESIAYQQYNELQRQTIQLERFNTDLAFSIAKELDNRLNATLSASLEKALAPLAATMSNMADRSGEINQDAMTSMVENFSQNLQQSAGVEMKALGDSLAETKDSLKSLVVTLQSAGGKMDQRMTAAGNQLQAAAAGMEQSLRSGLEESTNQMQIQMGEISKDFHSGFTESSAKFSAAIAGVSNRAEKLLEPMQNQLAQLTERLSELSSGLEGKISAIGRLNTQLDSLVDNTAKASERLEHAGEPIQRASMAIGQAAEGITETSNATTHLVDELTQLATSVKDSTQETTGHWASYTKRFEQVDKDLAATFREFKEGTDQQQAAVKEFVSGVDKELAKALRHLGSGVENLEEQLGAFTEAVEILAKRPV